jgi:hypothetical protein
VELRGFETRADQMGVGWIKRAEDSDKGHATVVLR